MRSYEGFIRSLGSRAAFGALDRGLPPELKNTNEQYVAAFLNFPVYMGCTSQPTEEDVFRDMFWVANGSRAPLEVEPVLPNELIYQANHNEPVGGLWKSHHKAFGEFVAKHAIGSYVYEIGGAHGLASISAKLKRHLIWTIHDLNPIPDENYIGEIIEGNFGSKKTKIPPKFRTVVHSHTIEHVHSSIEFLQAISKNQNIGDIQIFSYPNMDLMLSRGNLNFLNFEHTAFLPLRFVREIIAQTGYKIVEIYNYLDHSIFISCVKVNEVKDCTESVSTLLTEEKADFERYFLSIERKVKNLNDALFSSEHKLKFIFGAHVFTQMLIAFGLETESLSGCLDNSKNKVGKRLYGTNLEVFDPTQVLALSESMVVMSVADYAEEIKAQINEITNGKCQIVDAG